MSKNFYIGINNRIQKIENIYYSFQLPNEYQQIEYIETDGEAYIMTTHEPSANTRTIAEFSDFDITKDCQFFGVRINSDLQTFFNWTKWDNESAFHFASYIGNNAAGISVSNDYNGEKFKVDKNKFSCTVTINNQSYSANNTENTFEKFNVYGAIFGFTNQDGTVSVSQPGVKLYSYQTYNGDTLVRNYIPCYRKNDRVFGLYDTIKKIFYTSEQGSLEPTEIIEIHNNKVVEITEAYFGISNVAQKIFKKIKIPIMTSNNVPKGVATASNADTSHPAFQAFDGNSNTMWQSTNNTTTNITCTYDFGEGIKVYPIKITIYNYATTANSYKFQIRASKDNTNWVILYTSTKTTATNETIVLDNSLQQDSYRYFQYRTTNGNTKSRKGLYIFQVEGYEA